MNKMNNFRYILLDISNELEVFDLFSSINLLLLLLLLLLLINHYYQ